MSKLKKTPGSGNVFADLGFPPEELLVPGVLVEPLASVVCDAWARPVPHEVRR